MRCFKQILIISILIVIETKCKEIYRPPSVQNNPHLLIVDGIVINGNETTIITLSRTKNLSDPAPPVKELNARVSVLGMSGAEYPFTNKGDGQYVTDHLLLDTSQQYQLKIITSDGNEFRSEPAAVRTGPSIDTVYWIQDSAGVHIYLNTHDPVNNTRYYRWENVETWEYHSAYDSHLEYIDENNIILRPIPNQIFRCYNTQLLPSIEVASTARLSSDIVYKYEVINLPTGSEKLTAEYSDLVKQYAISLEAFNFWTNLKKNTEQLGTLFDLQPFTELGNIQCISNPSVKCIGFISFSNVQERRIFLNKNEIYSWDYKPYYDAANPCMLETVPIPLVSQYFSPPGGPYANSLVGQAMDTLHTPVYLYSTNFCVDCTLHGGNTIKPSYWP